MLRNLSTNEGIVNGTRAIVTHLLRNVIQLQILTGHTQETYILLTRFTFIHESTEDKISLRFKRRQFSIRLALAMTINKCQNKLLNKLLFIWISQFLLTDSCTSHFRACQTFPLFTFLYNQLIKSKD